MHALPCVCKRTPAAIVCILLCVILFTLTNSAAFLPSLMAPLRSFVPRRQQLRVYSDYHVRLTWPHFEERWRCDGLRWRQRGVVERQLQSWRVSRAAAKRGLAADIDAKWRDCRHWFGTFARIQIIGGVVYHVPPPVGSCPNYGVDELRLEAAAAVITRLARYYVIPDMELLLNVFDDYDFGNDTMQTVPIFAFTRAKGRRTLLLPFFSEPAFPFLDTEDIVVKSTANTARSPHDRNDGTECTDVISHKQRTREREAKWRNRRAAAVFRGSDTGPCHADGDCFLSRSVRGKLCSWVRNHEDYAAALDFALVDDVLQSRKVHPAVREVCRFAASLSVQEQAAQFNAQLLLDGNTGAWRILNVLPRDMLTIYVESCCETYLDLVLDVVIPTKVSAASAKANASSTWQWTGEGEAWGVHRDLSSLAAALDRVVNDTKAAMATAASASAFSLSHLNDDAQMCYTAELLEGYASLWEGECVKLHPHAEQIIVNGWNLWPQG